MKILNKCDIVVAGAGPAGIAAAIAASQNNQKVTLLEQTGTAGGMTTSALVPPIICQWDGVNYLAGDFCRGVVDECCTEMGISEANPGWQEVNPEIMKRLYDRRIAASGVKLYYGIKVVDVIREGGKLKALIVSTPTGLKEVRAKVFIDCTGDAMVSALAQVPFDQGDEEGNTMSPTLCPQFSNIDLAAYRQSSERDLPIWHRLLKAGKTPTDEHHFVGVCVYGHGSASGNLGHIYNVNTLDEDDLTKCYIEGRKLAKLYHEFYMQNVPGFAESDLVQTAPMLGVRETRRIRGHYQLNMADYQKRAKFADEIGRFAYPVDIHASKPDPAAQLAVEENIHRTRYNIGESYGVPYRSLVPLTVDNLLVAGRSISADRAIQSSIRVVPGCMLTGQAAGCAATIMVARNCDAIAVPIAELQQKIREFGGYLA